MMLIYHGSTEKVEHPEIRQEVAFHDFGRGFYTTSSYEQAKRWALIKMRRESTDIGFVSVYEFDFERALKERRVKKFENADMEWLHFVVGNRTGSASTEAYDMTIGPVADDKVYQSIKLFETGFLDAEETLKRLKTEVLHDQWTFHTTEMLKYCRFVKADNIS